MRLRLVAVALEPRALPIAEAGVRAEFALEHVNKCARPVRRRRIQESTVPLAEAFRGRE